MGLVLRAELARVVLPMFAELPEDCCLVDCTMLFAHVQHARDIYRSGPVILSIFVRNMSMPVS